MREDIYNNGQGQSSILTTGQSSATSSKNVSVGIRIDQIKADISIIEDSEIQQVDLNVAATKDNSDKRKSSKKICQNCHVLKYLCCKTSKTTEMKVQYVHSDDSNYENKVLANRDNGVHEKNSKKRMIDLKSNTNICTTSNDVANSIDVNTQLKKSWEIRAFLTISIIAFQTLILTGPFVASFWIEVLSISPVTMQSRLLLSIPFLINSFSNPFLYAWRIPEIRQELRKLFRINA
ncbi:unnamed protein product [Mytilus coruscus]|uniref:G-protein coupled receptors family 1 profile domain-containing protein n=1 Tax=Mytilus coruscus TaxID=42192 RepID=A0A6J8BGA1_MYTCO|nr:unnamed protein product [Mytilus coruscus]